MGRIEHRTAAILALMMWYPVAGAAQSATAIAGTVTDSSGAVLPGVTVEASSPALIEKVRTAVTNSQGLYQIADLRAGVYKVTFTLPGFSIFSREGIELSAGFTATVSAQLRVGDLEETITVSGEPPLVDVRSVAQHNVVTNQLIQELPTGKSLQNLAVLIPGVSVAFSFGTAGSVGQDVGGNVGETQTRIVIHGSYLHDMPLLFDGMRYQLINGEAARTIYMFNAAAIQEVTTEAGVLSAEQDASGIWTNQIPKSGGNRFSGYFLGNYTYDGFAATNISAEQVAAGFKNQTSTAKIWDVNPAVGGPLKKDRLWFYYAFRYWGHNDRPPGAVHEANPGSVFFAPGAPVLVRNWYRSNSLQLTAQLTHTQKLSIHAEEQGRCTCGNAAASNVAWNASTEFHPTIGLHQATWTWTASNRLLVEAGLTAFPSSFHYQPQPGVSLDAYSMRDNTLGVNYNSPTSWSYISGHQANSKTSMSYVTGNHNLKVGLQTMFGTRVSGNYTNNNAVQLQLLNGKASSLIEYAYPLVTTQKLRRSLGFYAQENWTLNNHVTLNLGGRVDHLDAYVPANTLPATRFVPARSYAEVDCAPCWTDFNPRVGVAFDLFGDSKTAVKASVGRYVEGITSLIASQVDPAAASVTTAQRTWSDPSGTFNPDLDCDLTNPAANGGCGAIGSDTFGQSVVVNHFDPSLLTGGGKRWHNWEASVSGQRQLRSGMSVSAAYFRRWFGNFRVADNLMVTPADYDPYCVMAPTDARLPGEVSGQQICGLYDVKQAKFGQTDNLIANSDQFGKMRQIYDGVDLTGTVRMGDSRVQGGVSVGRTEYDSCFVIDSPSNVPTFYTNPLALPTTRFCNIKLPFQPQVRILGTYPLPWWDIFLSGTFQSQPPPDIQANLTVQNSGIIGLGRNLAAGANGTVVVPLIQPGTIFGDRLNQLDFRATKRFRVGPYRLQGQFDLYNALNANPTTALNYTYGPAWLTPVNILPGRLFKVGIQLEF